MTAQLSTRNRSRITFVAPTLSDFDLGVVAFKTGRNLSACTNDEQRNGWNWAGEDCYWRMMMLDVRNEPAIEDDYEFVRRGC